MEKMIFALATDDEKTYTNEHFGDARYFLIYEISPENIKFIKKVENTTEREEDEDHHSHHGDSKKAQGITQIMKKQNVNVMVAKVFGPNIKKVSKHFVCIYMDDTSISDSLEKLQKNYDLILEEWNKGEERKYLNFNKLKEK